MSALIAIGRWLLGGFGSLLGNVLGLVKRYPWQAACLALVLACWHLSASKADAEAGRDKALSAKAAVQSLRADERLPALPIGRAGLRPVRSPKRVGRRSWRRRPPNGNAKRRKPMRITRVAGYRSRSGWRQR
jgi:hypothetical protein